MKLRKYLRHTNINEINGIKPYALFDSGSTMDAVTPDFT
jgi:hypothetical protein